MPHTITDEIIEYIGILAKLELSDTEKAQAKKDIATMLDYIDRLNELDTEDIEPLSHIFPVTNVFREDTHADSDAIGTDGSGTAAKESVREQMLRNAPTVESGMLKVPNTVEQEGT